MHSRRDVSRPSDPSSCDSDPGEPRWAEQVLRAELDCPVFVDSDDDWETVRTGWNLQVDQHPIAVVDPDSAEDVRTTVRLAAERGLTVSVQPNGHAATEALSGTVLIRPTRMRDVEIDVERRTARVGAGVTWQHLLDALAGTGLTGLPGSTTDISVVAYHLGGGLSWFGRALGAATRYVRAWEVVDPAGELTEVTVESDPELFWALCGGGGDFGVVTAVEIELVPERPVYGGSLMWPATRSAAVLRAFHAATRQAPRELSLWLWLTTFPAVDPIPAELRGRSFANLNVAYLGDPAEAEALLREIRAIPELEVDSLGEVPMARLGEISAEPTDPMPAMDWSQLIADIDEDFQKRLLRINTPGEGSPTVACIRHLGGALAESETTTAAEAIDDEYLLLGFGVPASPEDVQGIIEHWAVLDEALGPHLTGRTHLNMLGSDPSPERAFAPETLERLRAIKRDRDPAGVIRGHRPVLGAGA